MSNTYLRQVRFEHCDPAGIVFYPRYIEMLQEVVEDWFADYYQSLAGEEQLIFKAIQARFIQPSRLGDLLAFTFELQVHDMHDAWLDCLVSCGEERRVELHLMLGCVRPGEALQWVALPRPLGLDGLTNQHSKVSPEGGSACSY